MQIVWRDRARWDLRDILVYLRQVNWNRAADTLDTINGQIARLADFPNLGRIGRAANTRELPIARTPYVVAYLVDSRAGTIFILRIVHGARRWPEDL